MARFALPSSDHVAPVPCLRGTIQHNGVLNALSISIVRKELMMIDNTRRIEIDDLEKSRTRQRLKEFIDQLKEKARDGTLECCAIRLHMKDGTSPIVVIGGTAEEQAAARANLETMEAEIKTQKAQCCSIMRKCFPQLPEEERR